MMTFMRKACPDAQERFTQAIVNEQMEAAPESESIMGENVFL
jgi:hypothetical protein